MPLQIINVSQTLFELVLHPKTPADMNIICRLVKLIDKIFLRKRAVIESIQFAIVNSQWRSYVANATLTQLNQC